MIPGWSVVAGMTMFKTERIGGFARLLMSLGIQCSRLAGSGAGLAIIAPMLSRFIITHMRITGFRRSTGTPSLRAGDGRIQGAGKATDSRRSPSAGTAAMLSAVILTFSRRSAPSALSSYLGSKVFRPCQPAVPHTRYKSQNTQTRLPWHSCQSASLISVFINPADHRAGHYATIGGKGRPFRDRLERHKLPGDTCCCSCSLFSGIIMPIRTH